MKKKVLIVGLTSIFALSVSAVAILCTKGKVSDFKASDSYTITIHPEDVTDSTEYTSGTFVVKTDQLKNDITLNFDNVCATDGGLLLQGNGYGRIYNTIGNEVRGMECIDIISANQRINVSWGFKESGSINYIDFSSEVVGNGEGYGFTLNGVQPNYFKVESGQMTDVFISEIVLTYPSECVEHENPYKTVDGVKYFRVGDEYYAQGFAGDPFENLVIPATINDIPVTEILAFAFANQTTLQTVSLPNTIKSISQSAFDGCSNLTSVTFATGGTEDLKIYDAAFRDTGITSLTLPKRLDYIEASYALRGTNSLTSIDIEDDYSEGNYKTIDGVLYRIDQYDGLELIHYPANSPFVQLDINVGVYKIHEYSCLNTVNLKIVNFYNSDDLLIDAYAFGNNNDNSSLENINFAGAGEVTIYWNSFRGYKHDLVLPENTIIGERGLGQMNGDARVFFLATEVKDNWHANWADSKNLTYGANVTFYLYSETAPVGSAPTNIDGFWHYVADVPTLW